MTPCKTKTVQAGIQSFTNAGSLPAVWDELIPQGHFLQRTHLSVTEQAQLPDVSFIYVLIQEGEKPVAAAYFQLLKIKEKHLDSSTLKPLQSVAWKAFTAIATPKLLVAGHLFRHDVQSFYHVEGLAPFECFKLYTRAVATVLKEQCAQAVLVKDMPAELVTYFQNYAPEYTLLRNDISMELDIPAAWQGMADYEKALKHKYAQRMRKTRQAWQAITVKELQVAEVLAAKEKIYSLYKQVAEKQVTRIGYLSVDFLPMLKQEYPDSLKVWGIYEGENMIGFFSGWVKAAAFDMFYIGFDYERNSDLQLYFNILFFSIEAAISFNKPKLILGRTALDAKARLGCKPRYLHTFLYIRNNMARSFIQRIQVQALSQEGEWEQRHPFRQ